MESRLSAHINGAEAIGIPPIFHTELTSNNFVSFWFSLRDVMLARYT